MPKPTMYVCVNWHQKKFQSPASLAFRKGNTPGTGGLPTQRVSKAGNVFMVWCLHMISTSVILRHMQQSCWYLHTFGTVLSTTSMHGRLVCQPTRRIASYWMRKVGAQGDKGISWKFYTENFWRFYPVQTKFGGSTRCECRQLPPTPVEKKTIVNCI